MDTKRDTMTDEELAAWHYAHRDDLERAGGEDVEVEISPNLSTTISFRLPAAEADAIRAAARDAGLSLSAWIRQACTDALVPAESARRQRALKEELHGLARELTAVAQRVDPSRSTPPTE